MKKCVECGAECDNEFNYCSKCGARLSDGRHCVNCGAELFDDARFCHKCGTPTTQEQHNRTSAFGAKCKTVIGKVKAYETENRFITNAVTIALCLVFIFVSLFAPIRVSVGGFATSMASGETSTSTEYASQSVYRVLGALGYIDLNTHADRHREKIKNIAQDVSEADKKVQEDYNQWYSKHQNASEEEAANKVARLTAKYYSEINMFAYLFAYTSDGSWKEFGSSNALDIADVIKVTRNEAMVAYVFALLTVALQFAIAVLSAVFLVLSIIGITKRRQSRLFLFLPVAVLLSGIGTIALSAAPMLAVTGAIFAVALTAVLSYFVCGLVRAIGEDKSILCIVKRGVIAALAVVAYFVLCSSVLSITLEMDAGKLAVGGRSTSAETLGACIEAIIIRGLRIVKMRVGVVHISTLTFEYSKMLVVGSVEVFIIGLLAVISAFICMFYSLKALSGNVEEKSRADIFTAICSGLMVVLAITAAIVTATTEAPAVSNSGADYNIKFGVNVKYAASAPVYVSMAFYAVAFVLALVFRPERRKTAKPLPPTADSAQLPAQPAQPEPERTQDSNAIEKEPSELASPVTPEPET